MDMASNAIGCICSNKDKNFKANHNDCEPYKPIRLLYL